MRIFLIIFISLFFQACVNVETKSLYYIVGANDTIAYLQLKNDSTKIAKVINLRPSAKIDSLNHRLYDYFELNGFETVILQKKNEDYLYSLASDNTKEQLAIPVMILDSIANTKALIRETEGPYSIILTERRYSESEKYILDGFMNSLNVKSAKFFKRKHSFLNTDLDYYAVKDEHKYKFYNPTIQYDSIGKLDYGIEFIHNVLEKSHYDNTIDDLDELQQYAIAIRDLGSYAKMCLKKESLKQPATNVIDSLRKYQHLILFRLRCQYEKVMPQKYNKYDITYSLLDEDNPNDRNFFLKSTYFVSDEICSTIFKEQGGIMYSLGIHRMIFHWSPYEGDDLILKVPGILPDDYIGRKESKSSLRF